MPDTQTMAFFDESRHLIHPKGEVSSRGWLDRKLPDGDVPEKIKKIAGWKRAMKEFMNEDPKLNDLVHLFTQKFVQMGQSRNFTLTTLLDLSWTVLILTWEAVINDRLPMMDEVERGFKEKYEDLQKTMMEARRQYLAEVSEHRDRVRCETLSAPMQAVLAEISEDHAEEEGGDHGVYRFQPELALDEATQEYFKAAMIENMKVALTKGTAAAGETIQVLMNQLKEAQAESDKLREQLEDALFRASLNEGGNEKRVVAAPRRPSVHDNGEVKKLQGDVEALKQELDGTRRDMERHKAIFQVFGLDPDCSVEVARKFFDTLTAPPPDDSANEVDQLKIKNAALMKQQKILEEEIQKLKRLGEDSTRKLQSQVKELQEENEKLRSELATKTLPTPGPDKNAEAAKKEADLQRQLELLRKQLNDATNGNDATKSLMKRNEELEAEVERLKEQLKAKAQEAVDSTKAADVARRQSTDLMAQMEHMRKQLENAKKELDDERRRSSVKMPDERPSSEDEGKMRQLQDKLKSTKEENENLKQENKQLRDALDEAKIMRKALEQAMEELKRKFEEFKKKLQEKGVDVSLLDEALLEVGMPSHPMNVFDRLYQDAVRRFNRFQEKWVVDMKNAQQETWERILGIYDGPPLTKEQVSALVQNGLIDIRRFAFDEAPTRSICPKCGYNLRASTPERRPHSQPSEGQRPRFGRMKTWAGSISPKSTGSCGPEFTRRDIYLDIVGFQPQQTQDRKPFAIISEADQYLHHCHLQRIEPLPISPKATPAADGTASRLGLGDLTPMSSKIELTPKGAMPSMPSPSAKDSKAPQTPKLATLESAMSMDLEEREVMLVSAPTPVNIEPPAPPVMQRRISGRDAKIVEGSKRLTKGNVISASTPALEPFTAVISGSKALPLPQIGPQAGRSPSPPERSQRSPQVRRMSRTNSQPLRRDPVDISISGVPAGR